MSNDREKIEPGEVGDTQNVVDGDTVETSESTASIELTAVQTETLAEYDKVLSARTEKVKELDLNVLTLEGKVGLAQSISISISNIIDQIDKNINFTDDEDYIAQLEAKKIKFNELKTKSDTFSQENTSDEKVTPPGATGWADPLYSSARDRSARWRKF